MALAELERLLDRVDALPEPQRAGALPIVVLLLLPSLGDRSLPPALADMLAAFEKSLGITASSTDDERSAAMEAHLAAHGLDGTVWRELLAAMRGSPADLAAAAHKLLASDRIGGALERTAPPPPGTVGAGPFARFGAGRTLDEKKR